jgi:hypothetical protein
MHRLVSEVGPHRGRRPVLGGVAAALSLAMIAAASCTGAPSGPGSGPVASPRRALPPTATASTMLERLVLTADLTERPGPWRLLTTIPFGTSVDELGLVTDPHRTPVPYLPRSFAVAPDGSLWILDVVKHRLAHYGASGRYLGEIGGFKFDRFSPRPRDVVFSTGQMYVLEEDQRRAVVVKVESDRSLHRTHVRDEGAYVVVVLLYPSDPGIAGLVGGHADEPGSGPRGIARFDPPEPEIVRFLPGVPVGPERWIDVEAPSDDDLQVVFKRADRETRRPIHVRVVTGAGPDGRAIPGLAGPHIEGVLDGAVATFVRISPATPEDSERYGGGVWLLRIGMDGGPLLWERLPEAGISDEEQARHLAAGPDGRLYLMVPTKEGERIYTR